MHKCGFEWCIPIFVMVILFLEFHLLITILKSTLEVERTSGSEGLAMLVFLWGDSYHASTVCRKEATFSDWVGHGKGTCLFGVLRALFEWFPLIFRDSSSRFDQPTSNLLFSLHLFLSWLTSLKLFII